MKCNGANMSFFDEYKPLRNKIRTFDTLSLVLLAIKKLHEVSMKPMYSDRSYMSWNLLFLIKIAFIEGGTKYPVKIPTENDLAVLHNMMRELSGKSRLIDEGSNQGLLKYMRMMAFQQFWLRHEVTQSDIGRQLQLFTELDWKYPIDDKFRLYTGISIVDFLELCFITWGSFYSDNKYFVDEHWFSTVETNYPNGSIKVFLNLISLSVKEVKIFLQKEYKKIRSIELQFYEQTPLKKIPLIKGDNKYYCYTPLLLNEYIRNFIYDCLKEKNSNEFSENFGTVFEKYIELCLDHIKVPYIPEKELSSRFPNVRKVIDFLIPHDECTIMIEAKAVEMSPLAMVNPTNRILGNHLKDSIIKAVKQLYSMAKLLKNNKGIVKNNETLFGIIITYKELYLTDGKDSFDEFIREKILDFLQEESIDESILPPENIFFLSIGGFEALMRVIAKGGHTMPEILTKAVQNNSVAQTKKFVFRMHLNEDDVEDVYLPYIAKPFDSMVKRIEKALPSKNDEGK